MQVEYKNKKIREICTNASVAERKYSARMAETIQDRIDKIQAMDTVEHLVQFNVGGCHKLKGNRKDQYAMVLVGGYRLVFVVKGGQIQIAEIIEIVDYH